MARTYIRSVAIPNAGNGSYLTLSQKPGGQMHSSYNCAVVSLATTKPVVRFYTNTVTCREQQVGGLKTLDVYIQLGTKLVENIEVQVKTESNTYTHFPTYNTELEDSFPLTVEELLSGVSVTITGTTTYGSPLSYTEYFIPNVETDCAPSLECSSDSSVAVFYVRDLSFPLKVMLNNESPIIFYTFLDMAAYFAEKGLALNLYDFRVSLLPPMEN